MREEDSTNSLFKVLIPNTKEELYLVSDKKIERLEDGFVISIDTNRRLKLKHLGYEECDELGFAIDDWCDPNLEIYFKIKKSKFIEDSFELDMLEGDEINKCDSVMYYFEHLDLENVKIIFRKISNEEHEIEISGEIENIYNLGENIKFYYKDIFNTKLQM